MKNKTLIFLIAISLNPFIKANENINSFFNYQVIDGDSLKRDKKRYRLHVKNKRLKFAPNEKVVAAQSTHRLHITNSL